jgi:hypothetical protein
MTIASEPPNQRVNTPEPTIEQTKQTAANLLPQLALGIVSQDVLVPFEEISKHNTWKYEASAGHPSLPSMGNLRIASGQVDPSDAWKAAAELLIKSLPEPIQAKLEALNALGPEERNNESFANYDQWAALNELVNYGGSVIARLTFAESFMKKESSLNEALLNSELISIVTDNMVKHAQEMAEMMKEELKKRENDPSYNATNYLVSRLEILVRALVEPSTNVPEPEHEESAS